METGSTPSQTFSVLPKKLSTNGLESPLTLETAIDAALENNPELTASTHEQKATEARYDIAKGAMLPNLSVTSGYYRHVDSQRLIPTQYDGDSGVFSKDILSTDIVLSLPLFTGGKLINEMHAADLLRQASANRLARTRGELVFNVSSVFYSILAQHHMIESINFAKSTLDKHLDRVNRLIAAQKAARVDRLRTEVRIAELDHRLMRERNILTLKMRLLSNLLGIDGMPPPLGSADKAEQESLPETTEEAATRQALSTRPDYSAARYELEAQAKRVDAARGGQWPKVSLQASYGGRLAENISDNVNDKDTLEDVGRIGVGMEIPFFAGGQIQARIREEREKLAAAQSRLHKLELQIRLDVVTALSNATSAHERMNATNKAIRQAQESFHIEQQKYELNKGTIVDVLDAQGALLETENIYYQAQADFRTALAQLNLATGEKK